MRGPHPGRLDRAEPLARPTPRSAKGDAFMAIDTTTPRSRRALLAGLAGGLAATVAAGLGRVPPASAHDPDDVSLGEGNAATSQTSISITATNGDAFAAYASGTGDGVFGDSPSGNGVYGTSDSGYGVRGYSPSGTAVYGFSNLSIGVAGLSHSTAGLLGYSGSSIPPPSPANTGVFGHADRDATSVGVRGGSSLGTGVYGHSSTGRGMWGTSTSGYGVVGTSPSGYGLYGQSYSGTGVSGFSSSHSLPAVVAYSFGENTGLQGYSGTASPPATIPKTGVQGYADTDAGAVGVRGTSPAGRGGVFKGGAAQLKLQPMRAASHPSSGQAGDLFVDASARLWFCKGGTTWVPLA
jgi:hypothetical protein